MWRSGETKGKAKLGTYLAILLPTGPTATALGAGWAQRRHRPASFSLRPAPAPDWSPHRRRTATMPRKKSYNFFPNFWRTQVLFVGPLTPLIGLLVASPPVFKAIVASLICTWRRPTYLFEVIRLHVSLTFKGENLVTLSFPFRFAISQCKWTLNVVFFWTTKREVLLYVRSGVFISLRIHPPTKPILQ